MYTKSSNRLAHVFSAIGLAMIQRWQSTEAVSKVITDTLARSDDIQFDATEILRELRQSSAPLSLYAGILKLAVVTGYDPVPVERYSEELISLHDEDSHHVDAIRRLHKAKLDPFVCKIVDDRAGQRIYVRVGGLDLSIRYEEGGLPRDDALVRAAVWGNQNGATRFRVF